MKSNLRTMSFFCGNAWRLLTVSLWLAALAYGFQAICWAHSPPSVNCLTLQSDGKILVGGKFTELLGQPHTNLARLNADGQLDRTFTIAAEGSAPVGVRSLVEQPDGKIIVGGDFVRLAGRACVGMGRLNRDGTLDTSFNPSVTGTVSFVSCLVVQQDGKILLGGSFVQSGVYVTKKLMRLNPDGTTDSTFPTIGGSFSAILVQKDGKIVVGGQFAALNGVARKNLGRLNPDGSLDQSFNPGVDVEVSSLLPQIGDRILVGGNFTTLAGQPLYSLGRLNADGTLDSSFTNRLSGTVICLAAQTGGKVIVGGSFYDWGLPSGKKMENIERLNSDGSWDSTFIPLAFETVGALAVKPDGQVLIAGDIYEADGKMRLYIQQMGATETTSQVLLHDGSNLTLLQRGLCPEFWRTWFEGSSDGTNWVSLGEGTRIADGWQLTGVSLVPGQLFRARVWTGGNGASLQLEPKTVMPGLVIVESPASCTNFTDTAAEFNVWAAAGAPCSYRWSKDGTPISGATSSSLRIPQVRIEDAGSYSVEVENIYGSQTSQPAALKVLVRPAIPSGDGTIGIIGGQMVFDLMGTVGQRVIIEASTNLVQWRPIGTNVLVSARVRFADTGRRMMPGQFYRLRAER